MATVIWERIETMYCPRLEEVVELMERRVYPAEIMPDTIPSRVSARRCSGAIRCNLAGYSCRWAFTNPDIDPFQPASTTA